MNEWSNFVSYAQNDKININNEIDIDDKTDINNKTVINSAVYWHNLGKHK
jgi:hypothetical protein